VQNWQSFFNKFASVAQVVQLYADCSELVFQVKLERFPLFFAPGISFNVLLSKMYYNVH